MYGGGGKGWNTQEWGKEMLVEEWKGLKMDQREEVNKEKVK